MSTYLYDETFKIIPSAKEIEYHPFRVGNRFILVAWYEKNNDHPLTYLPIPVVTF